jgi:RND family efflux transporter MFP subunit
MKTTIYSIAILSITLFATSCGSKSEAETEQSATNSIKVKVSSVTANSSSNFITASGKIEAANSANISTRMMGFVNNINVKVGQKVKKGQLLIAINNTALQAKKAQVEAAINEATAGYNSAEKDYNRFKNLFATQSISEKQMEDMATNFEMAKARLESAKQMKNEVNAHFAYSNITAPFTGVITNKFIEVGNMANPGMPLLSIEGNKSFEVTAMVPESQISKIKNGQNVTVLVKAINETINAKVTELSSSAKNTGGQYLVKIGLQKAPSNMLSGMFVTVQFPIKQVSKTEMVLIPTEALISKGEMRGVYTVSQQNTALLRWLRLGRTYGNMTEVLSGLNASEKYITACETKLYNGALITVQ